LLRYLPYSRDIVAERGCDVLLRLEIMMPISNQQQNDWFLRTLASVAMLGPILLVLIAATLPEGLARGYLIVFGNGGILVALAGALVLRTVYDLGFSRAAELAATQPNYFVAG